MYDALASERPYRPALSHLRCLEMMRADAASGGLDPELVERFCRAWPTGARPAEAVPGAAAIAVPA